ncbi:metallophosphoesterase family protein [Bacillus sp. FSL K6-3431]|uniref:metallophosphoesterase family protein n=1 Tax=Bacillus sp. FSL K6-3431 TaxID=2921500 RepID=UPI0030F51F56
MDIKIAIITDIHGNSSALKAVLTELDKDMQIDHIYCLGDLVGIGHETNEVLELLFSRNNISFVMGNHDEAVMKIIDCQEPVSKGEELEHHRWIASRLDTTFIPLLSQIPKRIDANYNGQRFLFTHYHLNESDQFLSIDNKPTVEKLDKLYRGSGADIVCFGHHHVIHHFKSKDRLYLNPSSLGCNHLPVAPYAIIKVSGDGNINISFNQISYDNKGFLLSYNKLNVPARDFILNVFYGNQHLKYA